MKTFPPVLFFCPGGFSLFHNQRSSFSPPLSESFSAGLFLKWVLSAKEGASSKLCGKAEGAESIVAQNIIRNGCRKISGEKALAVFCEIVKHSQVAEQKLVSFLAKVTIYKKINTLLCVKL